jgi:hypothetical protein
MLGIFARYFDFFQVMSQKEKCTGTSASPWGQDHMITASMVNYLHLSDRFLSATWKKYLGIAFPDV